jgi:2-hydroxymethylglutarate dehydrogenase
MPIATRLIKIELTVYGCDLQAERRESLASAGGFPVEQPSKFPKECKIFLLLLPNPAITTEAVFGDTGLISTLKEEDTVVSLGTIGPDAIIGLEGSLRPEGVHVLDAPMGKSSKEAGEGTLSLMVSGAEEIFYSVRPLLDRIASDITFCGDVGVASTIKIINNLVSGAILEVVAEGLVLGAKAGAPLALMVEVLSRTGADSYHLRNTFGQRVAKRDFKPGFSIDLETKDLKIGLDMAAKRQMPLPVIGQAFQRYVEGQAAGLGPEDWGALVKLAEMDAGVELKE